jgi:hypothetical protein
LFGILSKPAAWALRKLKKLVRRERRIDWASVDRM